MPPIEEVRCHADARPMRTGHGPANVTTLTRLALALLRHRRDFPTVPDGQRDWVTPPRELIAPIA